MKFPKPTIQKNKKGQEWKVIREKLTTWFVNSGFIYCELELPGCYGASFFAHAKVRNYCNENDLHVVANLCNPCHEKTETKDEAMEAIILSIRARNHIPELGPYIAKYTPLTESRKHDRL